MKLHGHDRLESERGRWDMISMHLAHDTDFACDAAFKLRTPALWRSIP